MTIDRASRVRAFCLNFPEVVEVYQFGYPWYKAGKNAFAIVSGEPGQESMSVNLTHELQDLLLQDSRFSRTHYVGQHGWVSFDLAPVEDETVDRLVCAAYRKVALKRMLAKLPLEARD